MTAEPHPQSKEISRRTIGPLDKRKITTRCQLCAKRRIKCDGGHPCKRCVQTKKACVPQESEQTRVKFVHASGHYLSCAIPMQVQKHEDTLYLDHFASFFEKCHFSAESATTNQNIVSIILEYPLLQHIAVAIGALDASRRASIRSTDKLQSPRHIAFQACGRSLQELHSTITTANPGFREDVFWCSFLHGIFELMAENSGNSFAMHMVFGMSKVLFQLKHTSSISPSMKTLIDAFWILEANRTILYCDNVTLDPSIYQLNSTQSWSDPMKQILVLMIQTSTFAKRLFDKIESIPSELRPFDIRLDALAIEGLEIKDRLLNWQQQSCVESLQAGPFNDLAAIVHHALLLYHCRNFTYYSCWTTRAVPQLHKIEVDKHVTAILDLSQSLLSDTYVPAVLLLFPLRMAGAHVSEINAQNKVLGSLRTIRQKGFIVSDVIEVDLQRLWQEDIYCMK